MWPFPKRIPVAPATPPSAGEDSQAAHRIIKEFFLKLPKTLVHTSNITTIKSAIMGSDSELRSLNLGQNLNKINYPEPLNGLLIDFERELSQLHEDMNKIKDGEVLGRYGTLQAKAYTINEQLKRTM